VTLRLCVLEGRAHAVIDAGDGGTGASGEGRALDLERATGGRLPSDPMACYAAWRQVRAGAGVVLADAASPNPHPTVRAATRPFTHEELGNPSPGPSQVFAVGINYRAHAAEMGNPVPAAPLIFGKWQSAIAAPSAPLRITGETCDFEAELVVVVGEGGRDVPEARAWDAVAGLCVGQDLSDRTLQYAGTPPQFGLGKSRAGYAPYGPWVTDAAGLASRDDLAIGCRVSGETMQSSRTSDMVFGVASVVAYLSAVVELRPGDVIFTGTPPGVGAGRTPKRFLRAGDVIETTIESLGTITTRCV
jgi:2-keto-4-pentenoate hydratase/2-oxohepta-3-ene-1,7-dioic acid hydratase in catechol pathway